MARAQDLCGLGIPAGPASLLGYTSAAVSGAGTTSADATAVKKQQTFIILTATGSDGIRMPADADLMVPYVIANTSGSTGKIYPDTGGTVNGGSVDAGESAATTVVQIWYKAANLTWVAVLGA